MYFDEQNEQNLRTQAEKLSLSKTTAKLSVQTSHDSRFVYLHTEIQVSKGELVNSKSLKEILAALLN